MRLKIPLTGTVVREGSVWGDGKLVGDPNDPIRLVDIDLGNVSWRMVDVDLENEEMEIEVIPSEVIAIPTGRFHTVEELDAEHNPIQVEREIYEERLATGQEKAGFLQHARDLIEGHTKDELYTMSKCSKLKKPFKVKE